MGLTRMVAGLLVLAGPALAQPAQPSYSDIKCARYSEAWSAIVARRGTSGLGQPFLARHAAFLASGCTAPPDVCPRSAAELEVANMLVMMAMNAGMASTFPPFSCR